MKVRVTQEIESTTPGSPHLPGTEIEHPDAWRLCTIFNDDLSVAEPVDDEAKAALQPWLEKRASVKATLEKQAALFREREEESAKVAEALRHAEFEQVLRGEQ